MLTWFIYHAMNTAKKLNQVNIMQSTHSIEEEAGMNYFGHIIIFNKKWNLL